MDAVNELHSKVCELDRELSRLADALEERNETLSCLVKSHEISQKRLESGRHTVAKAEKAIYRKEDELSRLIVEQKRAEAILIEQEYTLVALTQSISKRSLDFHRFSDALNTHTRELHNELEARGLFREDIQSLANYIVDHKNLWKKEELARRQYRDMMIADLEDQVKDEEHALSILATTLSALKAHHLSSDPPRPFNEQCRLITVSKPMESGSHEGSVCDDIIEVDGGTAFANAPPLIPLHSGFTPVDTRQLREMGGTVEHALQMRFTSYELSVSPWYQEIKRRRVDVYSLQEATDIN